MRCLLAWDGFSDLVVKAVLPGKAILKRVLGCGFLAFRSIFHITCD